MPKPSGISDADLTETDIGCLSRAAEFSRTGSAYALEHATRPSTIGFVLNSNPLALLAWQAPPHFPLFVYLTLQ